MVLLLREESLIEGDVQVTRKITGKYFPNAGDDAGQSAFVRVDHCGVSVGVGIYLCRGMHDTGISGDVIILMKAFRLLGGSDERPFALPGLQLGAYDRQSPLTAGDGSHEPGHGRPEEPGRRIAFRYETAMKPTGIKLSLIHI